MEREKACDNVCQEDDGCPTESAVLKREWRRLRADLAASQAECERLRGGLKKANDQAEHFEREWYLHEDEIERLQAILIECDEVGKIDGVGLCDAIDNDGGPYQSQHLADVLSAIRAGKGGA